MQRLALILPMLPKPHGKLIKHWLDGKRRSFALDWEHAHLGLMIISENVHLLSIERKDFLPVEPQSRLSFLILL
jgi:hypothetical protein